MTVRYTYDQRVKVCDFIKKEVKGKEYNFELGNIKGKYKIVGVKPYPKDEEYSWSPIKYDIVITEFYVMRYRLDANSINDGISLHFVRGYSNHGFSRRNNWRVRSGLVVPTVFGVFGIGDRDVKIDKVKWQ